jgi:hypothetical protein
MQIAVVNQSAKVANADVNTMCQAIQTQLNLHVFPAWNLKGGAIKFYANPANVPGHAWTIFVIDNDAQVPGALGFHQEEGDKITGYIMCDPILSNGGTVMKFDPSNPGQYTVSGTLSHEVIETVGDRFTNCYCDNGNTSWCAELCDPVEQIGYGVVANGVNVSVSDFVFPNFFNPQATVGKNGPFNYLKSVQAPYTILSGGYAIVRTGGPGTEKQIFGEAMPQWRRDMKQAQFARGGRRMALSLPGVYTTVVTKH